MRTFRAFRVEADSVPRRQAIVFGPNYRQGTGDRNDLSTSNIIANETSIHDTQNAMSASIGALYRVNAMVNLGFNDEKSPGFKTSEHLRVNAGFKGGRGVCVREGPRGLDGRALLTG
jgi:hypothetical protein